MGLMSRMTLSLRSFGAVRAVSSFGSRTFPPVTKRPGALCYSASVLAARHTGTVLCSVRRHSHESQSESLSSFLDNEIAMESAAWREREKGRPEPNVTGFDCVYDGALVTLSKRGAGIDEQVTVKFSVSASIDSGEDSEMDEGAEDQEMERPQVGLFSRPDFTVDIRKGNKILSFLCSFISPADLAASQPGDDDVIDALHDGEGRARDRVSRDAAGDVSGRTPVEDFQINEFAIYDADMSNEKHSTVYSADCSVIDGELYDRLLEFMEQKGIDDRFAEQLVRLATAHEHNCYVKLLRNVQTFVKE